MSFNLRKGKILLSPSSGQVQYIQSAKNDRVNGEVVTDKHTMSTDFVCRQLDFGFMKLYHSSPAPLEAPIVGLVVKAKRAIGSAKKGELGVCYERYSIDGRNGYSFIFENRFYDGFAPDEWAWLEVVGFSEDLSKYQFQNVNQLETDFLKGRFDIVFQARDFIHFYDKTKQTRIS